MSSKYADSVGSYKFENDEKNKPFLGKIDIIEKQRMEFIKEVLGFEEYLFEKKIIDKSKFADTATHISFREICDELIQKGWDENKLTNLKDARNAALHGEIPAETSFREAKPLINGLKK